VLFVKIGWRPFQELLLERRVIDVPVRQCAVVDLERDDSTRRQCMENTEIEVKEIFPGISESGLSLAKARMPFAKESDNSSGVVKSALHVYKCGGRFEEFRRWFDILESLVYGRGSSFAWS
jgi:hypothetical protein